MKKFLYPHSIPIIILCIGIFGLLGSFYNALDFPSYSNNIVYLWMIIGAILYCLKVYNKKTKYLTVIVLTSIGMGSLFFLLEILTLIEGVQIIITNDYYLSFVSLFTTYQTSFIVILLVYMSVGFMVTKILVYYLSNYHYQKLILIGSIIWLFFPYFINHKISYLYVYASILFVLSSYVYTLSLQQLQGKGNKVAIVILITLTTLLTVFDQTIVTNSSIQKNIIEIFDGLSYLKNQTGNGNQTGSTIKPETSLPTGNIETNVEEALKVSTTAPFSGYLRGYSLSKYEDNGWDTQKKGYSYPSINYYAKAISNSTSLQVQITSLKGHTYQFVPYYTTTATAMTLDSFVTLKDIKYTMYQGNPDTIVKIDQEYLEYAKDNYLEVNNSTQELLETYLQQKNVDIEALKIVSIEQKVNYIATLLKTNTSYSLTPGALPLKKDFIDYFLNDSKQGSCTHYATTATLLLRLLDVPTRYTSGFIIDKGDFQDNKATIRNNRSHAWVEVFDSQYGWYPVEMTPTSQQETVEPLDTPSRITTMLDRQSDISQNAPSNQTPEVNQPTPLQQQATINPWLYMVAIASIIIAVIIGVLIGQYKLRYQRKLKKYQELSNNKKVYLGCFYLLECKISIEPIESIYLKARFSQHQITLVELQIFENYVKQQVQQRYQTLPLYKKGIFRYIKAKG